MRNDKDFRKNCEILANDIVEESMAWRSSLEEPQDWHCRIDNFGHLQAAALLYIAANMPIPNERAKKPCTFCNNTEPDIITSHYFYIDSAQKQLVHVCNGEKTRAAIRYCPVCGRKL